MNIIGRGRYATRTYPSRGLFSPGSAMPFAQLGLSEPAPYTTGGAAIPIPFDTVVYESSQFGQFATLPDPLGSLFVVPFGVYLVTLQVDLGADNIEFGAAVSVASANGSDGAGNSTTRGSISVSASSVRFGDETPLPGSPLPCAAVPIFIPPAAGDPGTMTLLTKLFIWKLAEFPPSPAP